MPAPRGLKPGSKSCLFNAGLEGLLQPVALLPAAVATGLALPEDGFPEMIFSCFIVSAFISGHRARGCVPSLRDSFLSASLSPHLRAGLMNTVAGATGADPLGTPRAAESRCPDMVRFLPRLFTFYFRNRRSAATNRAKTMEITPFVVKKAALSLLRSRGETSESS